MQERRTPKYRVWVPGTPRSSKKSRKSSERYVSGIQQAAREAVHSPIHSNRIDIEIFFQSHVSMRADVDNVIKPILDALIGIVYTDDQQVRSVKATALPVGEAYGLSGWTSMDVLERLCSDEEIEFLIDVYEGLHFPGPGVVPKGPPNT